MNRLEPIIISTETLTLRFLTEAGLPEVYDIFSHPEVMRYWSYPPWTHRAQAEQWLMNVQEGYRTRNDIQLGIERRIDHIVVGTCTLFSIPCRQSPGRDWLCFGPTLLGIRVHAPGPAGAPALRLPNTGS